jgi:hypothetical protein
VSSRQRPGAALVPRARSWAGEVFTADLRSLAAFRIALAVTVLIDVADRLRNLGAHYTDDGVLPRADLLADDEILDASFFSINLISGSASVQVALFAITAIAAVALLAGYATRLMTLVVWLLVVSFEWRNPLLGGGGEVLLRILLFWALFLPLGAVWSVDRLRDRSTPPHSMRVVSLPIAALFLQMALLYWFAFLLKTAPEWRSEGSALSYALGNEQLAKPLATSMLELPGLLTVLTFGVVALEGLGPFLLLSPFWTGPARTLGVLLFMGFHAGIWLTLGMGIFPAVAGLAMVCFLPPWFWERVARLRGRSPPDASDRPTVTLPTPRAVSVVAGVALAFVVYWNLTTVTALEVPSPLRNAGVYLGIAQKWDMFAPHPLTDDGWYVVPATLRGGATVDAAGVLRGEAEMEPLSWRKPDDVRDSYDGERWRKYLEGVRLHHRDQHLQLSRYICREWNRDRPEPEQIDSFVIGFMAQRVLRDGEHSRPALRPLWGHRCGIG